MNQKIRQVLTAALAIVAAGLGTSLLAAPLNLAPGGSGTPPNDSSALGGTIVGSAFNTFTVSAITGKLGVKVLTGVSANPFSGGLTFVYEIKNTSTSGTEGITLFQTGAWAGVNTAVQYGNNASNFYFAGTTNIVQPGATERSPGSGNILWFYFPPDDNAPPIFWGENSYQLIVFTNATAFTTTTATFTSDDFDDGAPLGNEATGTVTTLTAVAPVPDAMTTALLLGMGLAILSLMPRLQLARVKA